MLNCGAMKSQSFQRLQKYNHMRRSQHIYKGVQHKFAHFLRTNEDMEQHLQPLDWIIANLFLPVFFGPTLTEHEKQHFALPIKNGGLRIANLTAKSGNDYVILLKVNAR